MLTMPHGWLLLANQLPNHRSRTSCSSSIRRIGLNAFVEPLKNVFGFLDIQQRDPEIHYGLAHFLLDLLELLMEFLEAFLNARLDLAGE